MIEIKNLSVSYETTILKDVNYTFISKIYGILGESGSGKSTLIKAILGLIPYEGEVFFRGKELKKTADRKGFQVVFQNPFNSFNPKRKIRKAFEEVIRLNQAKHPPESYVVKVKLPLSFLDKYPSELSGGELQRLAIGRALAGDPRVLVMDEPTSALDVSTQKEILDLLLEVSQGICVLFITHDPRLIDYLGGERVDLKKLMRK